MKISKLFHWLYGILMLLPCFAILVKCAYVAFNKNAYESYSGTNTQYVQKTLQTNEVNSNDDLVEGNVYKFYIYNQDLDINISNLDGYDFYFNFFYKNFVNGYNEYYADELYSEDNYLFLKTPIQITLSFGTNSFHEYNYFGIPNNYYCFYIDYIYADLDDNVYFYILQINENTSLDDYVDLYTFFEKCPEEYLQYTTYYEEVEVSTLDNVFYYAVDEVCNNELFAWASNSFLNAPLTYITNLFNMPTDNAVILLMSYWFNISIIWLCFDVMIYVPLLVHRWLDKGMVE